MSVRWISAVVLLLAVGPTIRGQDPEPILPTPPAARLAPMPGTATFADQAPALPPLLPVPPPTPPARKPCLGCATEYQPGHLYLPEGNPDCGAGGCDGECRACRQTWVHLSFLAAKTQALGDFDRGYSKGFLGGAGYWFTPAKDLGLDTSFLTLRKRYGEVLPRTLVHAPLTVATGDGNLRAELLTYTNYRLDGLVGYRYAYLHEHLSITRASDLATEHNARNGIHAAQVGLVGDFRHGPYFCELLAKLGVGRNSETIWANGLRTTDNIMALVPEFGARAGYQLGEGVYGTVGYTFLYFSDVARPGQGGSDFSLHALTIGVECHF